MRDLGAIFNWLPFCACAASPDLCVWLAMACFGQSGRSSLELGFRHWALRSGVRKPQPWSNVCGRFLVLDDKALYYVRGLPGTTSCLVFARLSKAILVRESFSKFIMLCQTILIMSNRRHLAASLRTCLPGSFEARCASAREARLKHAWLLCPCSERGCHSSSLAPWPNSHTAY